MSEEDDRELERRTKRLFDASVGALDGATRSKLTQARYRALQEARPGARRPAWRWPLAAAAAAAAAVVVAAVLVLRPAAPPESAPQVAAYGDLDLLTGEPELEMLDEEIEFYAWLEEQPEFAAPDATGDGVG
jgi:hypothetical protein